MGGTDGTVLYLPASSRYTGHAYRRIAANSWPPLGYPSVIVISALYGAMFPWEPIQDYNLTMNDNLAKGRKVYREWQAANLGGAVGEWCTRNGITTAIDLLTTHYRKALCGLDRPRLERLQFKYPNRGSGAMFDRGNDLNRLLQAFREAGSWR